MECKYLGPYPVNVKQDVFLLIRFDNSVSYLFNEFDSGKKTLIAKGVFSFN